MRSNRPSYTATPAGTSRAFDKKPKPRKPKKEINQMMLVIFFIVLPVLVFLAIFFQPFRYMFVIAAILALAAMWLLRAFKFPGRMILSALYGFLSVLTLVSALNAQNRSTLQTQQQTTTVLVTQTPEVTETPALYDMYNTMETAVPADYYTTLESEDDLDTFEEVGISNGTDESADFEEIAESPQVTAYVPLVKSDAEIALENFMERWKRNIIADMVDYISPNWKAAQETGGVQQALFWKFGQKTLVDWRQMSAPSGTDASTARTITVQADIEYNNELRTYQYDAIVLYEDNGWYVDPDSLSNGTLVVAATATPDPNLTPTPTPDPTPTPTPSSKMKLYYNKDGGKKYHADQNCPSVASKYLPLKGTFTYGDLKKSPYNKLEPCDRCDAPPKP